MFIFHLNFILYYFNGKIIRVHYRINFLKYLYFQGHTPLGFWMSWYTYDSVEQGYHVGLKDMCLW